MDDHLLALEGLIQDNPDLERLEALVGQFNPFAAMQWTRQEVRHTAFLRWLLDPEESHGLGVYPLRAFLKEVLARRGVTGSPNVFDAHTWDLSSSVVQTEWQHIDLLIRNDAERFVVLVENKVDSAEHSGQLARYRQLVAEHFNGYAMAFVYLTPSGDPPSDDTYEALAYRTLADLVDRVVDRRKLQISDEVRTFLRQYAELVRRYIVEDSEVQELCRKLYEKHRIALDLIYEHRPDRALEVSQLLQRLIEAHDRFILDQSSKSYIRFATACLEEFPKVSEGWTKSRRLVLFEFENYNDKVSLKIVLGPGPDAIREQIREGVVKQEEALNKASNRFGTKWWTFHRVAWLPKKSYVDKSLEEVEEEVSSRLTRFVNQELPALESALGHVAAGLQQ